MRFQKKILQEKKSLSKWKFHKAQKEVKKSFDFLIEKLHKNKQKENWAFEGKF